MRRARGSEPAPAVQRSSAACYDNCPCSLQRGGCRAVGGYMYRRRRCQQLQCHAAAAAALAAAAMIGAGLLQSPPVQR